MRFLFRPAVLLALCVVVPAQAQLPPKPPAHAVASAHPLATEAGMQILQAGGNAFDAAVAVSAALAVVEPTGSGLGGGGFWLTHRQFDNLDLVIDGREVAPIAATGDMYLLRNGDSDRWLSRDGPLAAAIPGEPAALVHISRTMGNLPLAQALAPAIRYARDGFIVDSKLAGAIARHQHRLSPAAAAIFAPQNQPLPEGATLRQPDLARTLERLASGGLNGFYDGRTAELLLAGVKNDGGIWSDQDLKRYRIIERNPLVMNWRGHRIVAPPPPSAGGVALIQALKMLDSLGWPTADETLNRHFVVEVLRRVYRDRAEYLGDPAFTDIPLQRLLSNAYLGGLAHGISRHAATPSNSLPTPGNRELREHGDTSHLSVLDADGNYVAATLSINLPFGSGYMPPGSGVLLNDEMDDFSTKPLAPNAYGLLGSKANGIRPGKRMLSSMTPTLMDSGDGLLIIGTPGGSRIITMVLLGILEYVQGASATEIVAAPRFHHQYLPDEISYESGAISEDAAWKLVGMGHHLRQLPFRYGNMQVVYWDKRGGRVEAASDPRGVGGVLVVGAEPAADTTAEHDKRARR